MKTNRFIFLPAAIVCLSLMLGQTASAGLVGTDDASQSPVYDDWGNGDDGAATGDGFGAWNLTTSTPSGGFAGFFIGDSTSLGGSGINSAGEAFGIFGNQGEDANATAFRELNGDLAVGQTFSIDLAVNFRNGNKGFNLLDTSSSVLFNFNVGGDNYVVNSALTGNGAIDPFATYSPDTNFNLSFTQTSGSSGNWSIARSGGVTDLDSGTYSGVASSFNLYITDTGNSNENNLFANNLSVSSAAVPEPTSLALVGLGLVSMLVPRKR